MSNNLNILLVGAGNMGKEYSKVLKAQGIHHTVVCRKEESALKFMDETGIMPLYGGIQSALHNIEDRIDAAIVAVDVDQLSNTTIALLNHGIKRILVEKPAGLNRSEIEQVCALATSNHADVFVAYNRRFYASTEKATEIIDMDGGVTSFNFEFTEWSHVIEQTKHSLAVKAEWLLCNSSHVIDLAFFLGGYPLEMSSFNAGKLPWHDRASK